MDYLTSHTNLSPIQRGFAPGFVGYKKKGCCTRLAAASDKAYQLLAHGRWCSPGIPASSTAKTGRYEIAEILLKVALNTKKIINLTGIIRIVHSYCATCMAPTFFIEVPVPSQERERSCICVLGVRGHVFVC